MDKREEDIRQVCQAIIESPIRDTGDYGDGGECPFCFVSCGWKDSIEDIKHKPNCVYYIAKDLLTK